MEASDKGEPASKRGRKIGKGYKGDDFKTKKKSKSPTRKKSKSPTRPKKPKSLTGGNNDDDYIPRTPTRQRKKIIINSRSSLDRGSSHSLEEFHANKSPKSPKKKKAAAGQIRKPKIALLEESRSRMSFRKGPSVTKTLTALLKTPSNRSCADCRSALVDPSEIHASFCPSGKEIHLTPEIAVAFHDFQITHQAFAPPDVKGDPIKFGADPAMFVNQRFGGHGVFICAKCAEAHKRLGKTITVVHHLQDPSVWTNDHAEFMKKGGGNARSWLVYEAYLPEGWKKRRPNPSSLLQDRLIFCRAKYEALAFTMPPPGPLSEIAWLSILERNNSVKRFAAGELRNIHNLTPTYTTSQKGTESGTTRKLPNRLIDFFCVVNSSMQLHPHALEKDLSTLNAPEELMFWPQVCDCFPIRTAHDDMEFPEHLPSFVLPDGCHPSTTQKPPTFFTFVLTLGDGDRLYGGALHIHDETTEMDDLYKMVKGSGYEGPLPRFLTEADEDQSDIVFFPKCLVILSHHPFFDLFREFLQQIYRITFVEAPLPIERYIANIACEVPLPPQGEIKVEFGFTTDRIITIQRPPVNRLPLANFSFRPLFASLSVGNILVVLGCLLQECKVALMSQYYSILCPTTEALLSALFPFEWQGLYIPIMPTSLVDILDAPVPFLVGMDSKFFYQTDPTKRPSNVVFVDLDRDMVYMGYDEETGRKRDIPALPSRDVGKLKSSLDGAGGSVYLIPNNGIKGCIMAGRDFVALVENEERPKYAEMSTVVIDGESLGRREVFSMADKAYDGGDITDAYSSFQTECGQIKDDYDSDSASSEDSRGGRVFPKMRRPKFLRNKKSSDLLTENKTARHQGHLLETTEPEGFSTSDIRNAFLRFFVTIFSNYDRFLSQDTFDVAGFLDDLNFDGDSRLFLYQVLGTQMFQRFLEERRENPDDPEILFFEESIVAKQNRSKATTLTTGGKKKTPFLDNTSWKVTKTFTPPPPSNIGLSHGASYHYETFPALNFSKVGQTRKPMMWNQKHSSRESMRFKRSSSSSAKVEKTQQEIVKKAMWKNMSTTPGAIAAVARRSARDLETALAAMSPTMTSRKKIGSVLGSDTQKLKKKVEPSKPLDRMVNTLSRADTIMINTRRKQSILLDLVIKLQAMCRMFVKRTRFKKFRRSVVRLQNQHKRLSLTPKVEVDTNYFKMKVRKATIVQSYVRRFLADLEAKRRNKALCIIQRKGRGYLSLQKFTRMKMGVILIQRLIQARRTLFIFGLLKTMVSRVQARSRGILVRKRFALVFERRMSLYREQIFFLWEAANVSLSLRTKLWPTISTGQGFSRLWLAEAELSRLWSGLGIQLDTKAEAYTDESTRLGDLIGLDKSVYCMCNVSVKLLQSNSFPEGSHILGALQVVQAERLQIYERLDSSKSITDIGILYKGFDIPANEKLKKFCLANVMWTKYNYAKNSFSAMMLIFPELESSLNIAFHNPSRKGRNRFPKAQDVTSPPVEKILWDQISLEGKLKKHVQEVASIYITKVPRLMAKLDEAEEKKSAKWKSLQSGVMKSYNTNNWSECRNRMVAEYLSGRFTTKQARAKNPHAPPKSFGADIPEADGTVENLAAMSGTNSGTLFDDNNIVTEETSTNPFKDNSETTAEDTTTNPFDAGSKPDSSTNPFEDNSKTSTEDTNTNPFDEVSEPDRNTNPFDKKYIDTNNHA